MFRVVGNKNLLSEQWAAALAPMLIRHPNRKIKPLLTLTCGFHPDLSFELTSNPSSDEDVEISPFRITNVKLTFFPGVQLARQWLAAAWACFLQHEALELVTVGDLKTRVLDPHENRARLDYIFHTGFPFELTPSTMLAALATAIPRSEAEEMCRHLI